MVQPIEEQFIDHSRQRGAKAPIHGPVVTHDVGEQQCTEGKGHAWWSSSSKSDSLTMADSEAPMPPVFMHSSTMIQFRVFLMLLLMVSMSNGFRLIRSITCVHDGHQLRVKLPLVCHT